MMILFSIGAISVAVLKIDPEILNRLAIQLVADALADGRKSRMIGDSDCAAERSSVRRILIQSAEGNCAELGDGVGGEELGAAVNGVHRLSAGAFTRMFLSKPEVRLSKRGFRFG